MAQKQYGHAIFQLVNTHLLSCSVLFGKVLVRCFKLHLKFCELLLKVVQLHANVFAFFLGELRLIFFFFK